MSRKIKVEKLPTAYADGVDIEPTVGIKSRNSYFEFGAGSNTSCAEEIALWRAVITQALQDAKSKSDKPTAIYDRNQALFWLFEDRKDFYEVCINAGLDPKWVRQKAIAARENGYRWRKEPRRAR